MAQSDRYDVGILLVHGIGDQRRADTVVKFGESIADCLTRWLTKDEIQEARETAYVGKAVLRSTVDGSPAHASLIWMNNGKEERWLLAESWWAEAFTSPRYSDLLKWTFRILPWTIATHLFQRFHAAKGWWWKLFAAIRMSVGIALLPLVGVLLVASLTIGLLPIPRIRTAILRLQRVLLGTVGDSYVLSESSIRGVAMSSQVTQDFKWLKESCDKVSILAHSQGAAVTHVAVRSLAGHDSKEPFPALLVTFGSGLRKLLLLRGVGKKEVAVSWILSFALIAISFALWQIIGAIWRGDLANFDLFLNRTGWSAEYLFFDPKNVFGLDLTDWRAFYIVTAVFMFVLFSLQSIAKGWRGALYSGLAGIVIGAVLGPLYYVLHAAGPNMFALLLVAMLAIVLCIWIGKFARNNEPGELFLRSDLTWADFYAAADPVPNGPISNETVHFISSTRVNNRNAILSDHTTYWENVEQFVLPVIRLISSIGKSTIDLSRLDPSYRDRSFGRRIWRVGWLAVARLLLLASVIVIAYKLREDTWVALDQVPAILSTVSMELIELLRAIPVVRLIVPESEKAWLPVTLWVGAFLVGLAAMSKIVWAIWCWWDASDRAVLFRRKDYAVFPVPFVLLLIAIATFVIGAFAFGEVGDFFRVTLPSYPDVRLLLESGWSDVLRKYPSGVVGGVVNSIFAALLAAIFLGMLVDWWNWSFSGRADSRDEPFDRFIQPLSSLRDYLAFTLPSMLVFQILLLSVDVEPLYGLSRWTVGLVFFLLLVVSVLSGLALWAIFQFEWFRSLWMRLQLWSRAGPLGAWLAVEWRQTRSYEAELTSHVEALLEKYFPGSEAREGFRDASTEAEMICRIALGRGGELRPLLARLAETFPQAGIAYAKDNMRSDPGAAAEILKRHAHSTFPRVRWEAGRLLRRLEGAGRT